MPQTIRLGTASPPSQPTAKETISQISAIASRAACSSIDILLLPEAFIGGYPRGTSFGCIIGNRSEEGREEFAKYFDCAIDLGDTARNAGGGEGVKWVKRQIGVEVGDDAEKPVRGDGSREELEKLARDTDVFIVVGCVEKAGGSLYCSVLYICPKEGMVGKRRKVMPTGTERLVWAQSSPSTLRAVSTTIRGIRINLAAAICWENYMPLLRQTLYSQNVNLYLAPTADNRDTWLSLMRTVGIEGRCFVVSSNMCVKGESVAHDQKTSTSPIAATSTTTEEGRDLPTSPTRRRRRKSVYDEDGNEIVLCGEAIETEAGSNGITAINTAINAKKTTSSRSSKTEWISRGGSSIVSPYGDVLAGPQWEDPDGLIYADVDFRDCIRGRLDFDAAGSYSRSDAFKFSVEGLDLDPLPY